jgi:hypothetical protein
MKKKISMKKAVRMMDRAAAEARAENALPRVYFSPEAPATIESLTASYSAVAAAAETAAKAIQYVAEKQRERAGVKCETEAELSEQRRMEGESLKSECKVEFDALKVSHMKYIKLSRVKDTSEAIIKAHNDLENLNKSGIDADLYAEKVIEIGRDLRECFAAIDSCGWGY